MHVLFGHWLHSFLDPIWWHRPTYLSTISLAPDDLTLITQHPLLCHSWNHDTAQFDCIHFTDEAHLGYSLYSPDSVYPACSPDGILCMFVWQGQPYPSLRHTNWSTLWQAHHNALRPVNCLLTCLNDQSLDGRLIAINCYYTITLFDVYTGHSYSQCWDPGYKHGVDWRWNCWIKGSRHNSRGEFVANAQHTFISGTPIYL